MPVNKRLGLLCVREDKYIFTLSQNKNTTRRQVAIIKNSSNDVYLRGVLKYEGLPLHIST